MFFQNNDEKVKVVAEIGMTHDGSIGLAKKLTEAAIASRADVIKYQWHIAGEETVRDAPNPPYFKGESRFDYFTRTEFTVSQFSELVFLCKKNNVTPCVSVFSNESVRRALKSGFEIIKIPSGEVTNIPMLRIVAETGLPVILSSGMSNWDELSKAVDVFKKAGTMLCVMQCSSMYPTPPESVGLNILNEIKERFNTYVGLSDHTLTGATAVAAVTLGAKVIEKHFTISKSLYGPDARFSLDPDEFHQLVNDVNFVDKAMRSAICKDDLSAYSEMKNIFQKSIVARKKINPGDILTMENIAFKKPGNGIPASEIDQILGKVYEKEADLDTMIERNFLRSS
jgi:N,N'-diacetyllegionaminate synthase